MFLNCIPLTVHVSMKIKKKRYICIYPVIYSTYLEKMYK